MTEQPTFPGATASSWWMPGALLVLGLLLYLAAAGTLPYRILMSASVDDALYIRLGIALAKGQWLGPYTELTLAKGPIFPMFLAAASTTGLPYPVVLHVFYFFCCWYFAAIVGALFGDGTRRIRIAVFLVILLSPAFYAEERVLREPFYAGVTLLLLALTMDFLFRSHTPLRTILLGLATGAVVTAFWLTREEGVWLVPGLAILAGGAALLRLRAGVSLRSYARPVLSIATGIAMVVVFIGSMNAVHYGRFVIVEQTDAAFQRAMVALQRVGGVFEKTFISVPREARELLYVESPSFAVLKPYLEPAAARRDDYCVYFKFTCGDNASGWFVWNLRAAVAQAGFASSARTSAKFYVQLAREVEQGCRDGRLPCLKWLPPLLPPITAAEWRMFPATLGRAILLPALVPSPSYSRTASELDTPDADAALAFLNRPAHTPSVPSGAVKAAPPTEVHSRTATLWTTLLAAMVVIDRLVLVGGLASAIMLAWIRPRAFATSPGLFILACIAAVAARMVILALVEISSFWAVYPSRMIPGHPLALAAAVAAIALFMTAWRAKQA